MKKLTLLMLITPVVLYGDSLQQINNRIAQHDLAGALAHTEDVSGINRIKVLQNIVKAWDPTQPAVSAEQITKRAHQSLPSAEAHKIESAVKKKLAAHPAAAAPGGVRVPVQPQQPAPVVAPISAPAQPSAPIPPAPPLVAEAPQEPSVPVAPEAPPAPPAAPKTSGIPKAGAKLKSVLPARTENESLNDYYNQAIQKYDAALKAGNHGTAKNIIQRLVFQIQNDEKELGTAEHTQIAAALHDWGLYPLHDLKASFGSGNARTLTEIQEYYLDVAIPTIDQAIQNNDVGQAVTGLANLVIQFIKDANVFVSSETQLVGILKQLRDRGLYPLTQLYQTVQCVHEAKKTGAPIAACIKKAAAQPIARPTSPLIPKGQAPDQHAVDAAQMIRQGNFAGALKSISAARIGNRKNLLLQIIERWDVAKNSVSAKEISELTNNLSTFDKQQIELSLKAVESDPNARTAFELIGKGEYGQAFILLASIKKENRLSVFERIADMWRDKTQPAKGMPLALPITIRGTPYTKVDASSMYARAGELLSGADLEIANKIVEDIKKTE